MFAVTLRCRLATNQYLVRLSHALCRFWNLLTLHTPAARRRRARSGAALSALACIGPLQGQGRAPVARLPFGKYTMDYNGCEVLASYNALLLLGDPLPLGAVAAWYELRGLFLAGAWGTHVLAIPRFFRARGYAPEVLYASSVRAPEDYDAAFDGAQAAVFSFWNSAQRLRAGVHTVSLSHRGGRIAIDNLHSLDTRPNEAYASIADFIRGSGIAPIVLTTLRPRRAGGPARPAGRREGPEDPKKG